MARTIRIAVGGALLVTLLLSSSAFAQHKAATNDAEQVWAGEEAYWQIVKAHDAARWATLWSDDFVGWPRTKEHPMRKAQGVSEFKAGAMFGGVVSYELHRESVEMHGDAGITFYRASWRTRSADGTETMHSARLSHTWMKRDGRWQIVGGMSAGDTSPAVPSR